MLNVENYKKKMTLFLTSFDFKDEQGYLTACKMVLDKNGITDSELEEGMFKIISTKKKADMFGRPAPADLLAMMGRSPITEDDLLTAQKAKLIEKVTDCLVWDNSLPEYVIEKFNANMTEFEAKVVSSRGGIYSIWASAKSSKNALDFILRDLDKFFDDNYVAVKVEKHQLLEFRDDEKADKAAKFIGDIAGKMRG